MSLKTSGFNADTSKNLLLDAGAVYKNFNKTAFTGTLIGATQGGNSFMVQPNMRNIPIDGVKSEYVKGLTVIDSVEVSLTTNLLEVTKDTLKMALGAITETSHDSDYDSIKGKQYLTDNDYLENIAYVGKLSGSKKPVIIIINNALNHGGLSLDMQDAAEGKLPITFHGHVDSSDLENPPFEILYPKPVTNSATLASATFSKANPSDVEFTITSSGDAICTGVRLGVYALTISQYSVATGVVTVKKEYLSTLEVGDQVFTLVMDSGNNITAPKLTVGA